ncbi:hypothetical protein SCUP515_13180 [Seiridium cupressi]
MPLIKYLIAAFLGMAGISSAQRSCKNITIPVTISAENTPVNEPAPLTDVDVTNILLNSVKAIRDQLQSTETVTVSGSYNLSSTLCDPESGPSGVLQILTHGIGFDRRYWDFPFRNYNYSYVSFALDHNYSTLAWDRLGFALQALTNLVRHGNYSSSGGGYEKIVHVGHSLGSCVTYALHVIDPDISDAIILTGFSQFSDYQPAGLIGLHLVEANLRDRFAYYPPGYLIQGDLVALQTDFFAPGTFDPDILEPAYAAAEAVTVGELASAAYMAFANVTSTAPVLIVTGERDVIYCGTDCFAVGDQDISSVLDFSKNYFPPGTPFQTKVVEGASYGLNLDYNWPITYNTINDFLTHNGLGV